MLQHIRFWLFRSRSWGFRLFLSGIVVVGMVQPGYGFEILQPLPKKPIIPQDNPQSPTKIHLGQQLFFDPRLSLNGAFSCNHCHNVLLGGTDGRTTAMGMDGHRHARNTPGLWNVAYQTVLFWDGRAQSLETQFLEHIFDKTVMAMPDEQALVTRLSQIPGYVEQFRRVFKEPTITVRHVAKAVASYIRTLSSPDSPFDQYIKGKKTALSAQARRGLKEFQEVQCVACHFGVNFAGPAPGPALKMGDGFYELFPNYLGTEYEISMALTTDLGRYHVTQDVGHKYMWRVPPLRNIALTAPYFHNGSAATLADAVKIMAKTQLNRQLSAQQVDDIVAFLNSLTGKRAPQVSPSLPPTPNFTVLPTNQ